MSTPAVFTPPPHTPGSFTGGSGPQGPATYKWVLGWVLVILLLAVANQTETGHTIIYYALVLVLVFLLVTQYQFIAQALSPVGQKAPSTD